VQQASERAGRHRVVADADQLEAGGERVGGEDLRPAQAKPDTLQLVGSLDILWARGDKGRVDRADRGANEQIGFDAALVKRGQHAGLTRPEAGAA